MFSIVWGNYIDKFYIDSNVVWNIICSLSGKVGCKKSEFIPTKWSIMTRICQVWCQLAHELVKAEHTWNKFLTCSSRNYVIGFSPYNNGHMSRNIISINRSKAANP